MTKISLILQHTIEPDEQTQEHSSKLVAVHNHVSDDENQPCGSGLYKRQLAENSNRQPSDHENDGEKCKSKANVASFWERYAARNPDQSSILACQAFKLYSNSKHKKITFEQFIDLSRNVEFLDARSGDNELHYLFNLGGSVADDSLLLPQPKDHKNLKSFLDTYKHTNII